MASATRVNSDSSCRFWRCCLAAFGVLFTITRATLASFPSDSCNVNVPSTGRCCSGPLSGCSSNSVGELYKPRELSVSSLSVPEKGQDVVANISWKAPNASATGYRVILECAGKGRSGNFSSCYDIKEDQSPEKRMYFSSMCDSSDQRCLESFPIRKVLTVGDRATCSAKVQALPFSAIAEVSVQLSTCDDLLCPNIRTSRYHKCMGRSRRFSCSCTRPSAPYEVKAEYLGGDGINVSWVMPGDIGRPSTPVAYHFFWVYASLDPKEWPVLASEKDERKRWLVINVPGMYNGRRVKIGVSAWPDRSTVDRYHLQPSKYKTINESLRRDLCLRLQRADLEDETIHVTCSLSLRSCSSGNWSVVLRRWFLRSSEKRSDNMPEQRTSGCLNSSVKFPQVSFKGVRKFTLVVKRNGERFCKKVVKQNEIGKVLPNNGEVSEKCFPCE